MHSEKPTCTPSHLSKVSTTLPLEQFQCLTDDDLLSFLHGRSSSSFHSSLLSTPNPVQLSHTTLCQCKLVWLFLFASVSVSGALIVCVLSVSLCQVIWLFLFASVSVSGALIVCVFVSVALSCGLIVFVNVSEPGALIVLFFINVSVSGDLIVFVCQCLYVRWFDFLFLFVSVSLSGGLIVFVCQCLFVRCPSQLLT